MTFKEYRSTICALFIGVVVLAMAMLPFPLHAQMPKEKLTRPAQKATVPKVTAPVTKQQSEDIQRAIFLGGIEIQSLEIWPESQCQGSWKARIKNPSMVKALGNATAIPYQYRSDMNKWTEGPPVNFSLDKNQVVTVTGQWSKMMYSSKFKVAFRPENTTKTYGEKVMDLVIDPNRNVAVVGIETTDTYVAVTVRNNSPQAICELGVQTYLAKASDPNNWTASGGATHAILGNQTNTFRSNKNGNEWKQGWDLVKIELNGPPGSGIHYSERILPLQ